MHGVSKITSTDNMMLISVADADAVSMAKTLHELAKAGVVVDMISQSAPMGGSISFSFTAPYSFFETALGAIGPESGPAGPKPMVSGGYAKIYLFGEEMVERFGVASRALDVLLGAKVDISLITTSDLDISLLVRQEDTDVAVEALKKEFEIK
ncbi:aspartate kinase [Ruminococcaceae bacterium OttesenSCG-928-I18]|nr:aspartate kinase [Ruminococcaceae bacterium OttesenSCG-928-I18]